MTDHTTPGTFEEALAAAFGERASDFSEDLVRRLLRLYERGCQDARRESHGAVAEAHHRTMRAVGAARAMHEAPDDETREHATRALREMLDATMARDDVWEETKP